MTTVARPDSIAIEATALKESTGSLLILISDVLRGAGFPEQEVDGYRRARAQALRNETIQPGAIAAKVLGITLFGRNHYGAGDPAPEAMDLIDRQAIADYRAQVFVPGSTTLIMVGALPAHADLLKALTYVFGSWTEKKPPAYVPPRAPIEARAPSASGRSPRLGANRVSNRARGPFLRQSRYSAAPDCVRHSGWQCGVPNCSGIT